METIHSIIFHFEMVATPLTEAETKTISRAMDLM